MVEGFIVAGEGPRRRRVRIGDRLVVGRAPQCGLVISDAAASRQHLEVRAVDGAYRCRDLGSRNGTLVNGSPARDHPLRHGDTIRVGGTMLVFEAGSDEAVDSPVEKTVFLRTVLDDSGEALKPAAESKAQQLLEAAYTVMNAISTTFEPCELLDAILRTTMQATRAQRGAILFAGPDGELRGCGACGKVHTFRNGVLSRGTTDEVQISETVARRVLDGGENVLYRSARTDNPVDTSVSIQQLNLTSILCVPIRTQHRVLGILYLDTDVSDHRYTEEDLLLAAAVGNSAGLSLENSRIHRELLDKQRMENDIEAAWTIQQGFLVKEWPTDDPRFGVYGETRPARVVGGDFYDVVRLDGDTVGLIIGDVSGKGVPAALTMAQLVAEFRLCAVSGASPSSVLGRLNRQLVARSRLGTFCTMAYATVDLRTGRIVGASAGHHAVLRIAADGVSAVVEASGPPCGILEDATWRDAEASLAPGDELVMFTDGVVEARAGDPRPLGPKEIPEEYGDHRLIEVLRTRQGAGPAEIIAAVLSDVAEFCQPFAPHDDSTMVAMVYRGKDG